MAFEIDENRMIVSFENNKIKLIYKVEFNAAYHNGREYNNSFFDIKLLFNTDFPEGVFLDKIYDLAYEEIIDENTEYYDKSDPDTWENGKHGDENTYIEELAEWDYIGNFYLVTKEDENNDLKSLRELEMEYGENENFRDSHLYIGKVGKRIRMRYSLFSAH